MNTAQKEYIEQNIDLIEHGDWEKFFLSAPEGVGAQLYAAGIDFMQDSNTVFRFSFYNCLDLKSVVIPNGVTDIGFAAFSECSKLESVTTPNSLTTIRDYAFRNCRSLKSIHLPEGLHSIGYSAFEHCSQLKSISIPSSILDMGEKAFANIGPDVVVNFNGTKRQWKILTNISTAYNSAGVVICTDGELDF